MQKVIIFSKVISLIIVFACWSFPSGNDLAYGQMINVGTPFNSVGDSYFERMGVNFGFSIPGGRGNGSRIVGLNPLGQVTPNINFTQNGFGSAVPQFGNYDPAASGRFGFGVVTPGGGGFSLGFELGKGSDRSVVSTVPNVTVPNGYGGSIGSGALRPFVTGVVPVVFDGNQFVPQYRQAPAPIYNGVSKAVESGQLNLRGPVEPQPVKEGPIDYGKYGSSAESSDIGVAAIKAQRAAKKRARKYEAESLLQSAMQFEEKRDFLNSRIQIRKALKLIDDADLKKTWRKHLSDIRGK